MIPCPLCGAKTRVLATRAIAGSARRRRSCAAGCSGKVTTIEVVVPDGHAWDLIEKLQAFVAAIKGGAP